MARVGPQRHRKQTKQTSPYTQTIVDVKYTFMTVDIGAYGRQRDSGVFTESNIYRHLESGSFSLPAQ